MNNDYIIEQYKELLKKAFKKCNVILDNIIVDKGILYMDIRHRPSYIITFLVQEKVVTPVTTPTAAIEFALGNKPTFSENNYNLEKLKT